VTALAFLPTLPYRPPFTLPVGTPLAGALFYLTVLYLALVVSVSAFRNIGPTD
jgi:hypothetical protein